MIPLRRNHSGRAGSRSFAGYPPVPPFLPPSWSGKRQLANSWPAVLALAALLLPAPGHANGLSPAEGDAGAPPKETRLTILPIGTQPRVKAGHAGTVELFIMERCSLCTRMINFLNAKGIPYIKHDIEKDRKAAQVFRELGGRRVPLTRLGTDVVTGYAPDDILRFIKKMSFGEVAGSGR
jgi:glutaredoxin